MLEYTCDPNLVLISVLSVWIVGVGIGAGLKIFLLALSSSTSDN
jgi:hypothetical protein